MSTLPKSIQAEVDAAESIQRQIEAEAAPVGNPVDAPVAPEPVVPAQAEPEAQKTPVATPPVADETWEQRFRIMEGKFKAEVPRLHEKNRELTERLEQAIQALEAKKAETPPPAPEKLVTDAEIETFGADLLDVVRRAAREEFATLSANFLKQLDAKFGAVSEQAARVEQKLEQTDQEKFWTKVMTAAPDFDAVNDDPRWFAFLDTRMPATRFTRRALAEEAIKTFDAVALLEQIEAFKATAAPATPTADTVQQPVPPSLDLQVAPNSNKASTPAPATGRIWTGEEYAAALDTRNLHRISRDEFDAQVAEAEQALAEGRVRF